MFLGLGANYVHKAEMTRRHIKPCHILVFASAPGMCVWVFFKSMAWCKANVIFADKDYGHAGKEVGDSWKYVHEACLMSRLSEIFISTEAVVGWSARYRHLFICVLLILFYIVMQMACFLLNSFSLHPKEMTIQQVIVSILACIGFCLKIAKWIPHPFLSAKVSCLDIPLSKYHGTASLF